MTKKKANRRLKRLHVPSSKPPEVKLYSTGEVSRACDISRQVLHNYTVLGFIKPAMHTETNRRYYDENVFKRIALVRRMLRTGYTLQMLREMFPWDE